MQKRKFLSLLSIIVVATLTIVGYAFYVKEAYALNSHSIDLERSNGQSLSIADANQTGLDLTGDLTLEAWVKFESLPSNDYYPFIAKWPNSGDTRAYNWRLEDSGGAKSLIFQSSTDGTNPNNHTSSVSWSPSVNTWYYVAVTYDASEGEVSFYVDGSQQGSTQTGHGSSIYNNSDPFYIGELVNIHFDGLIDDVRVWSQIRSEAELSDNMLQELNGDEVGLVGYWQLNNSLTDSTSNGNTLTNVNSATYSTDIPFVSPSFSAIKTSNESVTNSVTLQDDDDLNLTLASNTSYEIKGVIFATSTSPAHIKINFDVDATFSVALAMTNDVGSHVLLQSGADPSIAVIPADTPIAIHVQGTVQTEGSQGNVQLQWAQGNASSDAVTVLKGSYLKAEKL